MSSLVFFEGFLVTYVISCFSPKGHAKGSVQRAVANIYMFSIIVCIIKYSHVCLPSTSPSSWSSSPYHWPFLTRAHCMKLTWINFHLSVHVQILAFFQDSSCPLRVAPFPYPQRSLSLCAPYVKSISLSLLEYPLSQHLHQDLNRMWTSLHLCFSQEPVSGKKTFFAA